MPAEESAAESQVPVEGDTVVVQYKCMNAKGEVCCIVSLYTLPQSMMCSVCAQTSEVSFTRTLLQHEAVALHWQNLFSAQIIEQTDADGPLTFEIGAGEIMGNKMFQVLQTSMHSKLCYRFASSTWAISWPFCCCMAAQH